MAHATETTPDSGYFQQRALRRYAGVWSIWALAVGAAISGHYSGWNFGLGAGGFGGMFFAVVLATALYGSLACSLAEMSAAMPYAGGAYAFVRAAMGPRAAEFVGLAETIHYTLTPAVIVYIAGAYLSTIFATPAGWQPFYWVACYALFVALNARGVELSMRVAIAASCVALVLLVVFWISAVPQFDYQRWMLNIGSGPDGRPALPFAVWLYLAIEQVPLAAEETQDAPRTVPKGLMLALGTLAGSALLTLVLNAGIGSSESTKMHGAFTLATMGEPLLAGLRVTLPGIGEKSLALVAVIGMIASFHTLIFGCSRRIFSLSRAGYLPTALSLTDPVHNTPNAALAVGAVIGYAALAVAWLVLGREQGSEFIGYTLLNAAVFAAMISYLMQSWAYIRLDSRRPQMKRPYLSPLGTPGAYVTILIALTTLAMQWQDPLYRTGAYLAVVCFVAGLLLMTATRRNRQLRAPEEEFARAGRVAAPPFEKPAPAVPTRTEPSGLQITSIGCALLVVFTFAIAMIEQLLSPIRSSPDLANTRVEGCTGTFRDALDEQRYGPGMVIVPIGEFRMGGQQQAGSDEFPGHDVHILQPFAVSACEITVAAYREFATATGRSWPHAESTAEDGQYPAAAITWDDAVAYTRWLTDATGKPYRLLSEAQWEYAARAGSPRAWPWRNVVEDGENVPSVSLCEANIRTIGPFASGTLSCTLPSEQARTVGSMPANAWGLHDMIGNVAEWTADCYGSYERAAPYGGVARQSDCGTRTVRGGSWLSGYEVARFGYRSHAAQDYRDYFIGFRVARDLDAWELYELKTRRSAAVQAAGPPAAQSIAPAAR
jgi:ethanolamine permease